MKKTHSLGQNREVKGLSILVHFTKWNALQNSSVDSPEGKSLRKFTSVSKSKMECSPINPEDLISLFFAAIIEALKIL